MLVHSLQDFWHSIKKKTTQTWGAGTRTGVVKYGERIVSSGINTTGVGGFPKGRRNLSFLMLTNNNMFLGVRNGKIKN